MQEHSYSQTRRAMQGGDAFAKLLLGIAYVDEGHNQLFVEMGIDFILSSGEHHNCIVAKNIISSLAGRKVQSRPILKAVTVETDALEQLKLYADQDNMWAMTIYGYLLYLGCSNCQNQEEGSKYLNLAADKDCYLALEWIEEFGIKRICTPHFGPIYDALKNQDNSKFWIKD